MPKLTKVKPQIDRMVERGQAQLVGYTGLQHRLVYCEGNNPEHGVIIWEQAINFDDGQDHSQSQFFYGRSLEEAQADPSLAHLFKINFLPEDSQQ